MRIKSLFCDSLHELQVLRNVIFCALMGAIAIVLKSVASLDIGPYIRIGFSDLPNFVVDFLFGPVVGGMFGGTMDILKFFTKSSSGGFFPGFTLNAILGGIIYGIFLYKKPVKLSRIILAQFFVKLFLNVGLNTLWLSMLLGKAFFVLLPARAITNLVMWGIDSAIMYILLKAIDKSIKPLFHQNQ